MKCRKCKRCAVYLPPGFMSEERHWCTKRGEWREGCGKGRRGRPMRGTVALQVEVYGLSATNGDRAT